MAQICGANGEVLGTGFLVADNLLVSCAHVLAAGGYRPGHVVRVCFPRLPGAPEPTGRVLTEGWRDPQEQDTALVLLDGVPTGTAPLRLGSAAGCRGHRVRSLGFPTQAPPGGHFGSGAVLGLLPAADRVGDLLQLTGANDLTTGFSGGPVLDETTGLVVGMVTAITSPDGNDRGQGIAYATPTEVLREAWPALRVSDVSPYRGLEPFAAEHARWFRGREEAVRQAMEALGGGQRVLLLLGPSGAGKSSLVQAGVLPELAAGRLPGSDRWRQVLVRPGPDLRAALGPAGPLAGGDAPPVGGPGAGPARERVVLVVDQFEELLAPAEEPLAPTGEPRVEDLGALTALARAILSTAAGASAAAGSAAADAVLVLVMRDDFYPQLSVLAPELLQALLGARGVLNVPATLTSTELAAIVTAPAADLRVDFEEGLAQRIVSDVLSLPSRGAARFEAPVTVLPLLEVALSRLWESRLRHGGLLTHEAYLGIGTVTGALASWCDAALRELDGQQVLVARQVLTALVRPANQALNTPAARQQLRLDELRQLAAADGTPRAWQAVDEVLAVLSRHRVITTDRVHASPGSADAATGTPMAELIHDALIREWPTLRLWMEPVARYQEWLDRARIQYARWQEHRNPQDLPAGTFLAEGADLARRHPMPAELAAFLDAGRRHQQAAVRRSRRLNAILATFLVLALLASGLAFWQRQTAVTAQREAVAAQGTAQSRQHTAQSRQLAVESGSLLATDPDLASLLAVAAYRTDPTSEAARALSAAAALPLRRRLGHKNGVDAVAFSPDGRTLAAADWDHAVRLRDMATGRTTGTLTDRSGPVFSVAFSPDGRTLATGGEGAALLWDVATGRTTATLAGFTGAVFSLAFSPDGRTLATGGWDRTVRLWDPATGRTTATLTGHTANVASLAFSPDGSTLATASEDGTARLWDVATGRTTATFTNSSGPVGAVAFSPDGRTLATGGGEGAALLWEVATGRTIATLTGHTGAVFSLAFSPDGRTLATGGWDHSVRLWDVAAGRTTATLAGHTGTVASVAFSPDGRTLATGSWDKTVRLWDPAPSPTTTLAGHTTTLASVAFSPDGRTLATVGDTTALLWDVATGRTTANLTGHSALETVAFSPDGRTLATSGEDGTALLWDVAAGRTTATLTGHTIAVVSVAFSPDGRTLATGGGDDTARLWDVATARTIDTLDGHTDTVVSVAFSPDGRTLATGSADSTARLWDVATGRTTATFRGHAGSVGAVAFSPDGRTLATGSADSTALLWDVAAGRTTATLTGHTGPVVSVAFSPDGRTLATGSADSTARLWDVATGRSIATLTGHTGNVSSVAFSPDGRTLATGSIDSTARLWPITDPSTAIGIICGAVARDLATKEKALYLPADQAGQSVCP
ncbi:hypothetical protein KSE_62270 [Kitasatospora setae KM-6054]|uniref:Novel STAND NTPase 1 domain-containing protein n=1 Tax=Kitasatospora setae (strain ATCC 33774 / DSM 43861 / JCM 3304 / KCC A-0304 / NBRC 14216 / KM-6054) TaxID=452652 RepID=E4N1F8_KITSK|nr:hypothetical protein KSE_62270 [Kitasatospora setae KM-6054]